MLPLQLESSSNLATPSTVTTWYK